jgi:hypothetical protein
MPKKYARGPCSLHLVCHECPLDRRFIGKRGALKAMILHSAVTGHSDIDLHGTADIRPGLSSEMGRCL